VAHQNSQFAVRAPVAARSRLGAARRYRLRSLLDAARATARPEKLIRIPTSSRLQSA
jgi:hypothetical protein